MQMKKKIFEKRKILKEDLEEPTEAEQEWWT